MNPGKTKKPLTPEELELMEEMREELEARYEEADLVAAEATEEALALIYEGVEPKPLKVVPRTDQA